MSNRPALLGQRWATAEIVVTAADASAREAMHLQQAAAMRAFQRVMQPDRQKAKRTRGARRKPAAKAAASGLAGPDAAASSHSAPAASGPPGSGSSSSTLSESDEDLKESWHDVIRSLRAKNTTATELMPRRSMRPTQKDLLCEILRLQKWRQAHRQKHQQKCRRFLRRDHLWCGGHDVHTRAVATVLLNIVGLPQFPRSWDTAASLVLASCVVGTRMPPTSLTRDAKTGSARRGLCPDVAQRSQVAAEAMVCRWPHVRRRVAGCDQAEGAPQVWRAQLGAACQRCGRLVRYDRG